MKRFILALASTLALLSMSAVAADAGRVIPGRITFKPLKWRSYLATGNVDSLYAALGPMGLAAGSVDTSEVFDLSEMAGAANSHTTATTLMPLFRLWLYSSVATTQFSSSADSIALVTLQASPDGSTWYTITASAVGLTPPTAGNQLAGYMFQHAIGNAAVSNIPSPSNFSLARIIVGGTQNVIPACQILIGYNDAEEPQYNSGTDAAFGKWLVKPLKFVSNSIDSTTVSFVDAGSGAYASAVTKGVSLQDKALWTNVISTTSSGSLRLTLARTSQATINADSAYIATEVSCDGTNWTTSTTFTSTTSGMPSADAKIVAYDAPLVVGGSVGTTNSALWAPFVRARIRAPRTETVASGWKAFFGFMPAYSAH